MLLAIYKAITLLIDYFKKNFPLTSNKEVNDYLRLTAKIIIIKIKYSLITEAVLKVQTDRLKHGSVNVVPLASDVIYLASNKEAAKPSHQRPVHRQLSLHLLHLWCPITSAKEVMLSLCLSVCLLE